MSEVPPPQPPSSGPRGDGSFGPSGPPTSEQRNWAMLAHLSALVVFLGVPSFIGPLVVWAIKRDDRPFVASHAREALNFNLSVLIYVLVASIPGLALALVTFGLALILLIPLALAVVVVFVVLVIQAGIQASNGREFRYPLTLRLIS